MSANKNKNNEETSQRLLASMKEVRYETPN